MRQTLRTAALIACAVPLSVVIIDIAVHAAGTIFALPIVVLVVVVLFSLDMCDRERNRVQRVPVQRFEERQERRAA